jgi:hypothetical protein
MTVEGESSALWAASLRRLQRDFGAGSTSNQLQHGITTPMKPHDQSVAPDRLRPALSSFAEQTGTAQPTGAPRRNPFTAACMGLALAVFVWTFGAGSGSRLCPANPHPGANSRTTIGKLWDKHHDLTRASVTAVVPAVSRRPQNSPRRIAVSCSAIPLSSAGYRPAEERRPLTLSPNLSQVRLRAPPVLA